MCRPTKQNIYPMNKGTQQILARRIKLGISPFQMPRLHPCRSASLNDKTSTGCVEPGFEPRQVKLRVQNKCRVISKINLDQLSFVLVYFPLETGTQLVTARVTHRHELNCSFTILHPQDGAGIWLKGADLNISTPDRFLSLGSGGWADTQWCHLSTNTLSRFQWQTALQHLSNQSSSTTESHCIDTSKPASVLRLRTRCVQNSQRENRHFIHCNWICVRSLQIEPPALTPSHLSDFDVGNFAQLVVKFVRH